MVTVTSFVVFALAISMASCQSLQIFMSGRSLPNKDPLGGSPDALVYVLYKEAGSSYVQIGRTDDISDNNNPDWPERYPLTYKGGRGQMLKLEVWDADSPDDDDYMGYVEFVLADLYNAFGRTLDLNIVDGEGGRIIVTAQVTVQSKKSE